MPAKSKMINAISLKALAAASAMPVLSVGLAATWATPAAAQSSCTTSPLGIVNCLGAVAGIDLTGATSPITVIVEEGATVTDTIRLGTIGTGDVVVNMLGNTIVEAAGAPGLLIDSAAGIEAQVNAIATSGDGATGALLRAVDDVIFAADGAVTTLGNAADAINIQGRTVATDLNLVQTSGIGANGVEILATDGPISLTADLIETDGDLSGATILRGTGDIALSARAIRTGGTDAVAIDLSTDAAACVLLAAGGCDVTAAVEEVTTEGFGSTGLLAAGTGNTDLNIGILRTGGDEAAGIDLSADPSACAVIGVGACDTAFTVGELTTEGARSPGAIVRGVGDITADVGVLRTNGDEAVGLDLASDPTACAILGAGACDTSFSLGELTTSGAGATGILVRAAGDTTGNVGLLRTEGDDAAGIDIASDPTACLLVGAGACDVGLVADTVSTSGNGAAAVLIDTVGNVATDIGLISTEGDRSTGLGILLDPAACLVLGPGSCRVQAAVDEVDTGGNAAPGVDIDGGEGPIEVDAGTVDTGGANSPGIDVVGTGPIDVDAGTVTTGGDSSPGIVVDGADDPIRVVFGSVTTTGPNSRGVDVSGEGDITIDGGTVSTAGPNSDGVRVDGGSGTVRVDTDAVTTTGPGSNGIRVATSDGDQFISAGRITVSGAGSNGIEATATGCADVNITARDSISAAGGTAILASSGCAVTVATNAATTVSGGTAGIDVTSGTGSTITIGGTVASTAGPAIDADGGAALVTIAPAGTLSGRVDLTTNADRLVNNGLFAPTGTSDFGAGADTLVNAGTIRVRGAPIFTGLESFANSGLIDMVDQAADDSLTVSGNVTGQAGSRLAIDVASGTAGTPTDRLVIGGAATGTTEVTLNLFGGPGVINADGALVVDAASGSQGSFVLTGPARSGFVDYSLVTSNGDTRLFALPNELAIEPLLLPQMAQTFWYQSADAFSAAAAIRRDDLAGETGQDSRFWVQGYAGSDKGGNSRSLSVFGNTVRTDLRHDSDRFGVQGGVDFRFGSAALGVTGGYQEAETDFRSGTRFRLDGYNVGAYALFGAQSGFYGEVLAKVDFFDGELENGTLFGDPRLEGKSYGIEGEAGFRMLDSGMYVDLGAGLAYVRTDLDGFDASSFAFRFDDAESLRGRIGVRFGERGPGAAPFVDLKLLHEFKGDNALGLSSGGFSGSLLDSGRGTWGRAEAGFGGAFGGAGGFLSAWSEFGDVFGLGLRAGLRF